MFERPISSERIEGDMKYLIFWVLLFVQCSLVFVSSVDSAIAQTFSSCDADGDDLKEFEERFAIYLLNREEVESEIGFSVCVHLSGIGEGPSDFQKGASFSRIQERCYRLIHKDQKRRSDGFSRNLMLLDVGLSDSSLRELEEFVFTDEAECLTARGSSPDIISIQNKGGAVSIPFDLFTGIISPFEYGISNGFAVNSQRVELAGFRFPRCVGRVDRGAGRHEFFMLTKHKNTVIAVTFSEDPDWTPIQVRTFRIKDQHEKQSLKDLTVAEIERDWNLVSSTSTEWKYFEKYEIYVPAKISIDEEEHGESNRYRLTFRNWTFEDDIDPTLLDKELFRKGGFRPLDKQKLVNVFADMDSIFDRQK